MYRFFQAVTAPLLEAMTPDTVVEIGSDSGLQTQLLAKWCEEHGAMLHCVDPLPKYDVHEWQKRWSGTIRFHLELSLNALPEIGRADAVLIDGDHNWYTVWHELEVIGREAQRAGSPFPLVLLHDVGWPYGRRDLYYDPATIPDSSRQPHRRGGLTPDQHGLLEHGFNDHLENALHEGTPRNGVLTAVEDFVEAHEGLVFESLPGLHGLGILVGAELLPRMQPAWDDVLGSAGLRRVLAAVEQDRLERLVEIWDLRRERADHVERVRAVEARVRTTEAERDEARRQAEDVTARFAEEFDVLRRGLETAQAESERLRRALGDCAGTRDTSAQLRRRAESQLAQLRRERDALLRTTS